MILFILAGISAQTSFQAYLQGKDNGMVLGTQGDKTIAKVCVNFLVRSGIWLFNYYYND